MACLKFKKSTNKKTPKVFLLKNNLGVCPKGAQAPLGLGRCGLLRRNIAGAILGNSQADASDRRDPCHNGNPETGFLARCIHW